MHNQERSTMRRRTRAIRLYVDHLDSRLLLSGLTPAQISQAYGLDSIAFSTPGGPVKGDGSGQTIALIEAYHSPSIVSDLKTFDQTFHLPDPAVSVVNLAGSTTDDGWAGEEALDVEWAHAIAPGAKILIVEAASQSFQDLLAAVDIARSTPGVTAVSMSWGFSEAADETLYDYHFTTPAGHAGITFFAASGDSGTLGGAEWPSSSPNVVSVGGTTLNLDASGAYANESAWLGSGGGFSKYEPEPAYQNAVQSTGRRSTPDVSFVADPQTGVSVYATLPSTGVGSWQSVGGTSLGAPAWAGILAIVDQGRSLDGRGSLDGPTQTLPSLYGLPATDSHTVAAAGFGGGSSGRGTSGGFSPVWGFPIFGSPFASTSTSPSGANTLTGLGTPNGAALVNDLVASTITTPPPTGASPGSADVSQNTTTTTIPTSPPDTVPTTRKHHKKTPPKRVHPRVKARARAKIHPKAQALAAHNVMPHLAIDEAIQQLLAAD
jgi:subtilase family serine protease